MSLALRPSNNDRSPHTWAFNLGYSISEWSDEQRKFVREAQRLLNRYGDLMVEKGSARRLRGGGRAAQKKPASYFGRPGGEVW